MPSHSHYGCHLFAAAQTSPQRIGFADATLAGQTPFPQRATTRSTSRIRIPADACLRKEYGNGAKGSGKPDERTAFGQTINDHQQHQGHCRTERTLPEEPPPTGARHQPLQVVSSAQLRIHATGSTLVPAFRQDASPLPISHDRRKGQREA